jgi:hypothetical protein
MSAPLLQMGTKKARQLFEKSDSAPVRHVPGREGSENRTPIPFNKAICPRVEDNASDAAPHVRFPETLQASSLSRYLTSFPASLSRRKFELSP